MEKSIFRPWIGKSYKENNSKIFVLGESHYGNLNEEEIKEFTSYIVNLFLDYKNGKIEHEGWMTTFSKFSNILNNKELELVELNKFWNSIVFYNFVQKAIDNARVSPATEDFNNSYLPFLNILSELEPKMIIVWGQRLWNHLPDDHIEQIEDKFFLKYKNVHAEIFQINHPSSSHFNYSYWESLNKKIDLNF